MIATTHEDQALRIFLGVLLLLSSFAAVYAGWVFHDYRALLDAQTQALDELQRIRDLSQQFRQQRLRPTPAAATIRGLLHRRFEPLGAGLVVPSDHIAGDWLESSYMIELEAAARDPVVVALHDVMTEVTNLQLAELQLRALAERSAPGSDLWSWRLKFISHSRVVAPR
jgi:hypothetical protein